jgi:hypothetical protein
MKLRISETTENAASVYDIETWRFKKWGTESLEAEKCSLCDIYWVLGKWIANEIGILHKVYILLIMVYTELKSTKRNVYKHTQRMKINRAVKCKPPGRRYAGRRRKS